MSEDGLEKARAWVEASGRALELRVGRAFRSVGADVTLSFPYRDAQTGVLREGDVLARFWAHGVGSPLVLHVVAEAKSGKAHPIIAMVAEERHDARGWDSWAVRAPNWHPTTLDLVKDEWLGYEPFTAERPVSHLVSAHTKEGMNPANDAVRQALSAAHAHAALLGIEPLRQPKAVVRGIDQIAHSSRTPTTHGGWLVLAALVVEAPIYLCELGSDGDVRLTEVEKTTVWGHGPDGERRRVFVMRESVLSTFAGQLKARISDATSALGRG